MMIREEVNCALLQITMPATLFSKYEDMVGLHTDDGIKRFHRSYGTRRLQYVLSRQ